MGWEIFITNVSNEVLTMKDIKDIYHLRWRIEILFKCWKSYFKIARLPKDANKVRVESYVYCMLLFITLFQVFYYKYYLTGIESQSHKAISIIKFAQYIANNIMFLIFFFDYYKGNDYRQIIHQQILYYCDYESRKRKNYYNMIQELC